MFLAAIATIMAIIFLFNNLKMVKNINFNNYFFQRYQVNIKINLLDLSRHLSTRKILFLMISNLLNSKQLIKFIILLRNCKIAKIVKHRETI